MTPPGPVGVEGSREVEALGAQLHLALLVGQRLAAILEGGVEAGPGLHHGVAHDGTLLGRQRAEAAVEEPEG